MTLPEKRSCKASCLEGLPKPPFSELTRTGRELSYRRAARTQVCCLLCISNSGRRTHTSPGVPSIRPLSPSSTSAMTHQRRVRAKHQTARVLAL